MTETPTLQQIYNTHTGKVSDKWSIYVAEYDRIFAEYRHRNVSLLEIGIQNGGSLEIWGKYFNKARAIFGCEIDETCTVLDYDDARINLIIGNANSEDVEQEIFKRIDSFDLIIDDGSHQSGDIVQSFARYFGHLADGGIYVAEDLHCSYWAEFNGGLFNRHSSIAFFKLLADIVNFEHWDVEKGRADLLAEFSETYRSPIDDGMLQHIHSVEFVNSLCIVRKAVPAYNVLGPRIIAGEVADVWAGALTLRGSMHSGRRRSAIDLNSVFSDEIVKLLDEVQNLESQEFSIALNKSNAQSREASIVQADQKIISVSQKAREMLERLRRFDSNES